MAFRDMLLGTDHRQEGVTARAYVVWIAAGFLLIMVAGKAATGSIDDALGEALPYDSSQSVKAQADEIASKPLPLIAPTE